MDSSSDEDNDDSDDDDASDDDDDSDVDDITYAVRIGLIVFQVLVFIFSKKFCSSFLLSLIVIV